MKDDAFVLKCSIINNLFNEVDRKIGAECILNDGDDHRLGDFEVFYKNSPNGNNLDVKVSKDLITNLIADKLNLDNVFEKLFP